MADAKVAACDCDLDLDPHRPNRDHYRACKATLEHDGLTVSCRVIRGHEGEHWAVFTREVKWGGDAPPVFSKLDDGAP